MTIQITPNVSLTERLGLEVPVSTSHANSATALGELTTAMFAFGHWDFYGEFAINDLIHTPRLFAAVGFAHRWRRLNLHPQLRRTIVTREHRAATDPGE